MKKKAVKAVKLPEKELKQWLKKRTGWNHDEWMALLASLEKKGYGGLVSTQEGRDKIGAFIELNRKK